MFIRFLLLWSISVSFAVVGQDSIMPVLNQVFMAYELNSDLAFIKNKAVNKKYNGNGLLYAGKERFYKLYDSIEKVIDDSGEMSRLDFYFLTAPLVQCLQDDQSYYSLTGEYAYDRRNNKYQVFADKTILPFDIAIVNDTAFIYNDTSPMNHCRVVSINNVPPAVIASEIFRNTSFSNYKYYQTHHHGYFNFYRDPVLPKVLFGFQNNVEIKYFPEGSDSVASKTIELLSMGDSNFYQGLIEKDAGRSWYSLSFKKDFAVLKINSLPEIEVNLYIINDIFRRIEKMKSKELILDISGCGWSHDVFWLVLLNYLYTGKLSIYEYQGEPQDLAKYTKKRIGRKEYIIGKFSDIEKSLKFKGNLYMIVGKSTASAAVRFADILRFNKIVSKIYGEETISRTTQYDYAVNHYLPVTKLRLRLSAVLNYALDKNQDNHGLLPDVEVKPDNTNEYWKNHNNEIVINKVINQIESGK